jgi:formiminotetrahydrofolate cyclodeaminase
MLLKDHTVSGFVSALASDSPAPGGGSAAALNGALASALLGMVCNLTAGREKYKEHEETIVSVRDKTQALMKEMTELIDEDTEAYNGVGAALAMPKDSPEQKKERSAALQKAMKYAAEVPFRTMLCCVKIIEQAELALGKTNKNCQSDVGVAALCAMACARGAWLNVKINLGSIKDEAFCSDLRGKATAALKTAETSAERLYQAAESDM